MELTAQTTFGQGVDDESTALQYAYAAYLDNYLIETYGQARFLQFYNSFAATPAATIQAALADSPDPADRDLAFGALAQTLTPQLAAAAFGAEWPAIEQGFQDWLTKQ